MGNCSSETAAATTSALPPLRTAPLPSAPPLPPSCLAAPSSNSSTSFPASMAATPISVPMTAASFPGALEVATTEFEVGNQLDVRDMVGHWYSALVVARRVRRHPLGDGGNGSRNENSESKLRSRQQQQQIRVRFLGWRTEWNEWVDAADARRVAPRGCMTLPLATPPTGLGDVVYAFGDRVWVALSEVHRHAFCCRGCKPSGEDGGAGDKTLRPYKWVAGVVVIDGGRCGRQVQVEVHGDCFDGDGSDRCDSKDQTRASDSGDRGTAGQQISAPGGPAWPTPRPDGQTDRLFSRDIGTPGAVRVWVHRGNLDVPDTWPHGGAVCEIQPRSTALSPPG